MNTVDIESTRKQAAKEFLLKWMSDNEVYMPSDLDIVGQDILLGIVFMGNIPSWNHSPFCEALVELVEEGKVKHWIDEKDRYCYQLDQINLLKERTKDVEKSLIKYHYQIIDYKTTNAMFDSGIVVEENELFEGYSTAQIALEAYNLHMRLEKRSKDDFYVKIYPVSKQ